MGSTVGGGRSAAPLGLAPRCVERPRLTDALDRAREHRLTVVIAPTGWGKTTLLTAWAAECGAPVIRLHAGHVDVWRLQRELDAALDGAPALVLDDLQVLSPAGIDVIRSLLRLEGVPVIAAGRAEPALGLPRRRLHGDVLELRARDLAFTAAELARLLDARGLRLTAAQRDRLLRRTEGWAAGISLALYSLGAAGDPQAFLDAFDGNDRAVADYLIDEVLAELDDETLEFVLRTCVVDEVCAELAAALTGRDDSGEVLERLLLGGVPIAPVDVSWRWYRWHPLFAELLRTRLAMRHSGLQPELHAQAAHWLADHGHVGSALAQVGAAGPAADAPALLERLWLEVMTDGGVACDRALAGEGDARLRVVAASEHLRRGEPRAALRALADAAPGDAAPADAAPAHATPADAASGPATSGPATSGPATSGHAAPAHAAPADATSAHAAPAVAALAALLRARARDDVVAARRAAVRVLDTAGFEDADLLRALAMFHLGLTELARGSVTAAGDRLLEAAVLARGHGRDALLLACSARQAALAVIRGDAAAALAAADEAVALAPAQRDAGSLAWARAVQATLALWRGDAIEAERLAALAAAPAMDARDGIAVDAIRGVRAHVLAAGGDLAAARSLTRIVRDARPAPDGLLHRWLSALGPTPWAPDPGGGAAFDVARALSELRSGDPRTALQRIAPVTADAALHPSVRVHALVVEALARDALAVGGGTEAIRAALGLADRTGYHVPFAFPEPGVPELQAKLRRIRVAPEADEAPAVDARPDPPGERLTERELGVLHLLATFLTPAEMAGELHISLNTVKTHIRTVYRKLDVHSRRDAVGAARELGLL